MEKSRGAVWGRIRFVSDTSRLVLKVQVSDKSKPGFDAYLDNRLAGSGKGSEAGESEVLLFENKGSSSKALTIYLPNNHAVRVLAIGIDENATIQKAKAFGSERPYIFTVPLSSKAPEHRIRPKRVRPFWPASLMSIL